MKIAYICSDCDVDVYGHDGCSVHIREVTNAFSLDGHDVFIIAAWAHDDKPKDMLARLYTLDGPESTTQLLDRLYDEPLITNEHLDRDIRSIIWNQTLQSEGARILEHEKPDFIYERYALFGTGGTELKKRFSIPLIMELNAPLCEQQAEYHRFTLQKTAAALEAYALQNADALVALTGWLRDWAVSRGVDARRIHIIPDAVSGELFEKAPDDRGLRRAWNWEECQVIGFVGSFHWWHDVRLLVEAFARVHQQHPATRLLLVGGGDKSKRIAGRVEELGLTDVLRFTGKIPHRNVPAHLAAMDIAVVPYKELDDFYFSPLKLFESMAAARPTVAVALGQITEIIEDGVNGLLYAAEDEDDLTAQLNRLISDPQAAQQMGSIARAQVLKKHTWEAVTKEIVSLVQPD